MEKQQGWDCGQDLHDGQKKEWSGSLCWSPSHRESWWGGQGCSTRARKGLRGEALDAKLQWADTGKLKGTLGDSRSMCPNFLSRGISNLKQLQTPSSKYVFPISSRLRKAATAAQSSADALHGGAEPFSSAAQRNRIKTCGSAQGSCRHWDLGVDPHELGLFTPELQEDKLCHK